MRPTLRLALTFMFVCCAHAHAATLTVTSLDDSGPGTLRETILSANSGDSIVFDVGLIPAVGVAVITLQSPLPTINRSLGIYGPGPQKLRLDGDDSTQLLLFSGAQNSELEGINISRGLVDPGHGGAVTIELNANVHMENCLFDYNSALNTGGAIRVLDGSLDVDDCSFFGNEASFGGAIMVTNLAVDVKIRRSRFQSNGASAAGGAIATLGGSLLIENSTFANNAAVTGPSRVGVGGALYADNTARITLVNNTFHNNFADLAGGAIRTQNTTSMELMANTALTGNQVYEPMAFPARIDDNCSINGSFGLSESNLEDANTCGFSFPSQFLTDPQYDGFVVRDRNGLTAALRPLPGSPLIDTGNGLLCAGPDVTGATRPLDGNQDSFAACDVGSFEYDGYSLFADGMEAR